MVVCKGGVATLSSVIVKARPMAKRHDPASRAAMFPAREHFDAVFRLLVGVRSIDLEAFDRIAIQHAVKLLVIHSFGPQAPRP